MSEEHIAGNVHYKSVSMRFNFRLPPPFDMDKALEMVKAIAEDPKNNKFGA